MILPFKKTYIYAGLGSVSGILKFENNILEVEFQTIDEIFRFFKSAPKKSNYASLTLSPLTLKKDGSATTYIIDVRSLKSLNGFPASNPDFSPRNFILNKAWVKWKRKRTDSTLSTPFCQQHS